MLIYVVEELIKEKMNNLTKRSYRVFYPIDLACAIDFKNSNYQYILKDRLLRIASLFFQSSVSLNMLNEQ